MKHARSAALEQLSPFLEEVRRLPGVVEKKLGIFYVKSTAYLHFHEDVTGVYADVKLNGSEFERFPLNTEKDRKELLDRLRRSRAP